MRFIRKSEWVLYFMSKKSLTLSVIAVSVFMLTACNEGNANDSAVETSKPVAETNVVPEKLNAVITKESPFEERAAYAFGASIGMYISQVQKNQAEFIGPLDSKLIEKGFLDALNGKSELDEAAIEEALMALNQKAQEAMLAKAQAEAKANLEAGEKFLEENKSKEGVKVTESGLQYKVIKEGSGVKPKSGDTISVKYRGTTIDGKVFDEQKEPVEFPLDNMIQGWVEGLALMSEGSTYEFYIPSKLAYGEQGAGDLIKPNSVLIFNVELVAVKSGEDNSAEASAENAATESHN